MKGQITKHDWSRDIETGREYCNICGCKIYHDEVDEYGHYVTCFKVNGKYLSKSRHASPVKYKQMNQNEKDHILTELRNKVKLFKAKWLKDTSRYRYKKYYEAVRVLNYWEDKLKTHA